MTTRVQPDLIVVRRQNDLFDLWHDFAEANADDPDYDPDDDPEFHAEARQIMGLPAEDNVARAEEDAGEKRSRTLALLGVTRAAGHDVTLGNDQLHHFWTRGEGLARWETWTELRDQLIEHVGPAKAATFASAWFHERYGFWPGDDRNRVKHGKAPRGHHVGPG